MKARQQLVRMRDSVVTVPEVLVEADYCCNNFSVSHARTHARIRLHTKGRREWSLSLSLFLTKFILMTGPAFN
jgi:hypothetical protein